MAVITVPASGLQTSDVTLDDTLQAGSDVAAGSTTYFEVDGASTLHTLYIGSSIEVDVGSVFGSPTGSLTGTGNVTGDNDPSAVLPVLSNNGFLDLNGAVDVQLNNNSRLAVSAGERLDVEGDFYSLGSTTIAVAAGAELDLNSQNSALITNVTANGTLKVTAPDTAISGATTLATLIVQGDALNAVGSGVAAARNTGTPGGLYVAKLELEQATFAAPITSVTLLQDSQIRFGTGPTTVQRLTIAGSSSALVPLDVVIVDGTLLVSGDGSGAANQVAVSGAEFTGGGTIDVTVAAADGGASLQQQLVVDASTTLRNDGTMTIGSSGAAGAATLGAATAASGSTFINGAGARLTTQAAAALSVAAIRNDGMIDVSAGTLALEVAVQGAGAVTVENGATLSVDAPFTQGSVALASGSLLRLSQPSTFASTLLAPATGATIDLAGLTATAATVNNGAIVVTTSAGAISLAETGLINGTTLGLGSDNAGGTLLTVTAAGTSPGTSTPPPTATSTPLPIYRFFDDVHGTQFLTASLSETQTLQATRPDLVYEGIGLTAANPATDPAAAPVYRFFDSTFGTHFYTDSATERDTVLATRPDLVNEGIGFYEHTTAQPGDAAVYRFFDSSAGTHFYTASVGERATIIATRPDLISEGIGFYAPSTTTT